MEVVVSKRRDKISRNGVVVAGSVWENRMRFDEDEVKGGINVFSEKEETPEVEIDEKFSGGEKTNQVKVDKKLEMGSKSNLGVGGSVTSVMSGKRKTWKSESSNLEGNPIQISRKRSEFGKKLDEQCKELTTAGAMKKSPVQSKKCGTEKSPVKIMKAKSGLLLLSDGNEKRNRIQLRKVKSEANNGNLRDSLQLVKAKSENSKNSDVIEENKVVVADAVLDESKKKNLEGVLFGESSDGNEGNGIQLRKVKSEANNNGNLRDSLQLMKAKSENSKNSDVIEENKVVVADAVLDESMKKNLERVLFGESSDGNEGNGIQLRKVKSEANKEGNEKMSELRKVKNVSPNGNLRKAKSEKCKELAENSNNSDVIEENKVVVVDVLDESKKNLEGVFGESSDGNKDGIEKDCELRRVESVSLDGNLRDSSIPMVKAKPEKCNSKSFEENKVVAVENCEEKVITSNVEPQQEKLNLENEEDVDEEINLAEEIIKTKKIVIVEENKVPISPIIKKQSTPISGQSRIHHHPSLSRTKPVPTSDESQRNIPRQHSKLESFVDLIMWRDASKSTLIFGIGTFFIISSSYTQELNISFISVISYLGLVYLATIFLFRSLRGANDIGESSEYIVGEEEAVWILKVILPYINECLLKIRALFSGDPATTMKMAVVLFILARCGSSITIWKMTKLGFFGVFIVPKVCSSYSTQLTAYGTFWIRRFRDAWGTCTHKKAVAFAIFTLIWNLSSISARIWAVFMLYVGFRYYQQKMMKEGCVGEEEIAKSEDYWQGKIKKERRIAKKSTLIESKKQKKIL